MTFLLKHWPLKLSSQGWPFFFIFSGTSSVVGKSILGLSAWGMASNSSYVDEESINESINDQY